MSTDIIRESSNGPPETVRMEDMSREQLLHWASLGSVEAAKLLLSDRPQRQDWQTRMAERMGRARGQA